MKFSLVTLLISSYFLVQVECGEYYKIEGRTYYSSYPDKRNWYEAKRFCTYNGMYLVDVRTDAENKRIRSVINQTETANKIVRSKWWTSGTDQGSENTFYWDTTGHPMIYVDWAKEQPDSHTPNEDCVQYWGNHFYKWNDAKCSNELYFMCRDTFDVPIYNGKDCDISLDHF